MIKLNKDTANQRIVVTATELVTLTGLTTYFLFGFTSDDTKETKYFVPEDISTNTCRYNIISFNKIIQLTWTHY